MKPDELQKELLRAQAKFQSAARMYLSPGPGKEVPLTNWVWPDVKQVQTMLQQRIMAAAVDPMDIRTRRLSKSMRMPTRRMGDHSGHGEVSRGVPEGAGSFVPAQPGVGG